MAAAERPSASGRRVGRGRRRRRARRRARGEDGVPPSLCCDGAVPWASSSRARGAVVSLPPLLPLSLISAAPAPTTRQRRRQPASRKAPVVRAARPGDRLRRRLPSHRLGVRPREPRSVRPRRSAAARPPRAGIAGVTCVGSAASPSASSSRHERRRRRGPVGRLARQPPGQHVAGRRARTTWHRGLLLDARARLRHRRVAGERAPAAQQLVGDDRERVAIRGRRRRSPRACSGER